MLVMWVSSLTSRMTVLKAAVPRSRHLQTSSSSIVKTLVSRPQLTCCATTRTTQCGWGSTLNSHVSCAGRLLSKTDEHPLLSHSRTFCQEHSTPGGENQDLGKDTTLEDIEKFLEEANKFQPDLSDEFDEIQKVSAELTAAIERTKQQSDLRKSLIEDQREHLRQRKEEREKIQKQARYIKVFFLVVGNVVVIALIYYVCMFESYQLQEDEQDDEQDDEKSESEYLAEKYRGKSEEEKKRMRHAYREQQKLLIKYKIEREVRAKLRYEEKIKDEAEMIHRENAIKNMNQPSHFGGRIRS